MKLFLPLGAHEKKTGGVSKRHSMFIDEDQNILASADYGESNNTGLTGVNQDVFRGAKI